MSLEQSARSTFAGHQTFHPRFGWVKKGFDHALADPNVFNRPDAPVTLGVGKNMVEAIRFWCLATRVLVREPHPEFPRQSIAKPTRFGAAILGEEGLDPWIEDPLTTWMLHWQALRPQTSLPVWWSAFNDFTAVEFTEEELLRFCTDEIESTNWSNKPLPSSVKKDVDCLLRMYTRKGLRGRQTLDDLLDSPFRELGLIVPAPSGADAYRFVRGPKPTLSPVAIAYACLDYMSRVDPGARTASLTRLTSDPGSPGRLLKLDEQSVLAGMEHAASAVPQKISTASPAGTAQLLLEVPAETAAGMLLHQYRATRGDRRRVNGADVAGEQAGLALEPNGPGSPARRSQSARKVSA